MICLERVRAYQLMAISELPSWLDQGWLLYGFPILVQTQVFQPIVQCTKRAPQQKIAFSHAPNKLALSIFERECVLWHLEGCTYKNIAERLKCAAHSVNNHFAEMRSRFECRNNAQLAMFLFMQGYINESDFFSEK